MKKYDEDKGVQLELKDIPSFNKNISPALELGVSIEEFDRKHNKPKAEKKVVILDFDESMTKTKFGWDIVNTEILRNLNLPLSQERFDYVASNAYHVFNNENLGVFKNMEEQKKYFNESFDEFGVKIWRNPELIKAIEFYGAYKEVIKELSKDNFILAMSSSRDLETILTFLKYNRVYGYFEKDLILASQGGKYWEDKPSPHMVDYIIQETGAKPENVVMIDDSSLGIKMGKAANVKTIGVGYGQYTSIEQIKRSNPDFVLEREEQIARLPLILNALIGNNK